MCYAAHIEQVTHPSHEATMSPLQLLAPALRLAVTCFEISEKEQPTAQAPWSLPTMPHSGRGKVEVAMEVAMEVVVVVAAAEDVEDGGRNEDGVVVAMATVVVVAAVVAQLARLALLVCGHPCLAARQRHDSWMEQRRCQAAGILMHQMQSRLAMHQGQ